MKNEQLITQIELYSNAMVGFFVVQAIAYCFTFGSNEMFNCLVKTARYLAPGLAMHFLVSMLLACYAILHLRRNMLKLSRENGGLVGRIYIAKALVVVLFSLLPLGVTIGYGVADYPNKAACRQQTAAAPCADAAVI